jgi:hypothetical protein
MSGTINKSRNGNLINLTSSQSCVRVIRKSNLPVILKAETEKFIERNLIPECGRVSPNCLKAFMIKTAQKMGLNRVIPYLSNMFKSNIGYRGYFLDQGKLFRVELSNYVD